MCTSSSPLPYLPLLFPGAAAQRGSLTVQCTTTTDTEAIAGTTRLASGKAMAPRQEHWLQQRRTHAYLCSGNLSTGQFMIRARQATCTRGHLRRPMQRCGAVVCKHFQLAGEPGLGQRGGLAASTYSTACYGVSWLAGCLASRQSVPSTAAQPANVTLAAGVQEGCSPAAVWMSSHQPQPQLPGSASTKSGRAEGHT